MLICCVFVEVEVEGAASSRSGSAKEKKNSQKKEIKRIPSGNASDDIDKMKVSRYDNAENLFMFITFQKKIFGDCKKCKTYSKIQNT